jgi:hypothetical protein
MVVTVYYLPTMFDHCVRLQFTLRFAPVSPGLGNEPSWVYYLDYLDTKNIAMCLKPKRQMCNCFRKRHLERLNEARSHIGVAATFCTQVSSSPIIPNCDNAPFENCKMPDHVDLTWTWFLWGGIFLIKSWYILLSRVKFLRCKWALGKYYT